MTPPRLVYTDLDGTLLGPGGNLMAGGTGPTMAAVEALATLARAAVPVVPISGRTEAQVHEAARMLGAADWIAELGGITVRAGTRSLRRGAYAGERTPWEAMLRDGAAGLLLERYDGALEPHAPWAFQGRQVTMLFRGYLDPAEATAWLEASGYGWLHVVDNGRIGHQGPTEVVHAYHLAPRGVDKAAAIADDLAARGLQAEDAVVVGDGPSEAAAAPHVRAVYIVANGAGTLVDPAGNVIVTEGERGEGFAQVVAELFGA